MYLPLMIDPTHIDFVNRWAKFVKSHPVSEWKTIQTEFINAQYDLHKRFVARILQEPGGEEKLKKIFHERYMRK